jgi:hypothetical protein
MPSGDNPIAVNKYYYYIYLSLLNFYTYKLDPATSLSTAQFRKQMTAIIYFHLHDFCPT